MVTKDLVNADGYVVAVPSTKAHLGKIILILLFLCLMVYARSVWPWSIERFDIGLFGAQMTVRLPLFALPPIVILAWSIHALFDKIYVICDNYLLQVSGRCSFTQLTTRLQYIHVKVVDVRKPFFGRILNYGDVIVSTDISQGDSKIILQGVHNPHHFKDLIQARIHGALEDPNARAKAAHAS